MISKNELAALPHDFSVLLHIPAEKELEAYTVLNAINHLPSILVTIGRPASNIAQILQKSGISTKDIYFIDAISTQINAPRIENTTYLHSAKNISDISSAIDVKLRQIPGKKTLIFDSISDLAHLHGAQTAAGFVQYLNKHLQTLNTPVIFLTNKKAIHINEKIHALMDRIF